MIYVFVTDDDSTWDTSDSACTSNIDYDDSNWHYVTGIKTGTSKLELYVDGILAATDSSLDDTNTIANNNPLYIGIDSTGTSDSWDGSIDDVKIYRYARNQSQIVEDMNGGHPTPGSPIGSSVAHWNFDEGNHEDTAFNKGNGGVAAQGNLGGTGTSCPQTGASSCPTRTNNGKVNKALSFDGGDYIDSNTSSVFNNTDWTISAWVNRTAVNGSDSIVSKRGADGSGGYSIAVGGSGEVYCQTDNGTSVDSSYTDFGIMPAGSG